MTQNSERRMRMTDGSVTDDLNAEQMVAEDLMLGMRMTRGVSGEKIAEARLVLPRLDETIDKLVEEGLAAWSEDSLAPDREGMASRKRALRRAFRPRLSLCEHNSCDASIKIWRTLPNSLALEGIGC